MKKLIFAGLLLILANPAWSASITALSDFDLPSDRSIVFIAMIRAGSGAPDEIYDGRTNQDQLEAGSLLAATEGANTLTINRIRPTTTRVIVNRSGGLQFSDYFRAGGALRDSIWHIQGDTDNMSSVASATIADEDFGGGFMNIRLLSWRAHARSILNNQLYIFALTMPRPPAACPYLGAGQTSLSSFRVGSATVSRIYLGSTIVCE